MKKKPQGFIEVWKARLHWLWCPLEAEKVWDYSGPPEEVEVDHMKQCFVVVLDDGTMLHHSIRTETEFLGGGWRYPCDALHEQRVIKFLQNTGQHGFEHAGRFYPHSRIDNVIVGGVEKWSERVFTHTA